MWDKPITAYTSCHTIKINENMTHVDLQKTYPMVFRYEIGHCTHFKVHLQLKDSTTPIFRPKIPMSYAAHQQVDEELRICGDYSTGLNDQLKAHTMPLPDEIYINFNALVFQ